MAAAGLTSLAGFCSASTLAEAGFTFGVILRRGLFSSQLGGGFLLFLEELGNLLFGLAGAGRAGAVDADEIGAAVGADRIAEAGVGRAADDRGVVGAAVLST